MARISKEVFIQNIKDTTTVLQQLRACIEQIKEVIDEYAEESELEALTETVNGIADTLDNTRNALNSHINNASNPHSVTKAQVGLGNVDNTSDANKPVSTATQGALNDKADKSTVNAHIEDTSNPHSVTKAQVGLGNVDNTSDANKPVSTATQTALNDKASLSSNNTFSGTNTFNNDVSFLNGAQVAVEDFDNVIDFNINKSLLNCLNEKQDALTAGTGITIDTNNVISASGGSSSSLYRHRLLISLYILKDSTLYNLFYIDIYNNNNTLITNFSDLPNDIYNVINYTAPDTPQIDTDKYFASALSFQKKKVGSNIRLYVNMILSNVNGENLSIDEIDKDYFDITQSSITDTITQII